MVRSSPDVRNSADPRLLFQSCAEGEEEEEGKEKTFEVTKRWFGALF